LFALQAFAAKSFTTVALRSNAANEPSGIYGELSVPALNDVGQIAYKERLFDSATRAQLGDALWFYDRTNNNLLGRTGQVLQGDPASGSLVGLGTYPYNFALNNSGQLAVYARASNAVGIWRVDENGWLPVAKERQVAPGSGPYVFGEFARNDTSSRRQPQPKINESGDIAFPGILYPQVDPYISSTVAYNGVWLWKDSTGLQRVFGYGDVHIQDGSRFVFYFPDDIALNDLGEIAGTAEVSADNYVWDVAWLFRDGQIEVVAPPDEPLDGIEGPPRVAASRLMGFNNRGDLALYLANVDFSSQPQVGIWKGQPSDLKLVVLENSVITLNSNDFGVGNFTTTGNLNTDGNFATTATLIPADTSQLPQYAVMLNADNQLQFGPLVGDPAPGTDASFRLPSVSGYNGLGQVVIQGILNAPSNSDYGIWATDTLGILKLIVREGDDVEVAPGDVRRVTGITTYGTSGNEDGALSSFNERGELAFRLVFEDGSNGIFISRAVAVPEPATGSLALIAIACCLRRRGQADTGIRDCDYFCLAKNSC
jgi:hypothetical protein